MEVDGYSDEWILKAQAERLRSIISSGLGITNQPISTKRMAKLKRNLAEIEEALKLPDQRVVQPVFRLSKFERWILSIVRDCGMIAENAHGTYDFADSSWEFGAYKPLKKSVVNRLYKNGYLKKIDLQERSWRNRFQGTEKTESLFPNGWL